MSRDNAIYVRKIRGKWHVKEGSASTDDAYTDAYYKGAPAYGSRADALVAAHDMEKEWQTEYGVIEAGGDEPDPSGWIPVGERLPGVDTVVLANWGDDRTLVGEYKRDGTWVIYDRDNKVTVSVSVKYWRPLPAPPA